MMFLHFWLLYGESECPLWIFGCRMVILNDCFSFLDALWRIWMTILHFLLPYGDFEWLVWIFGCPIAKLNELFILLHALSAKLDGKTYNNNNNNNNNTSNTTTNNRCTNRLLNRRRENTWLFLHFGIYSHPCMHSLYNMINADSHFENYKKVKEIQDSIFQEICFFACWKSAYRKCTLNYQSNLDKISCEVFGADKIFLYFILIVSWSKKKTHEYLFIFIPFFSMLLVVYLCLNRGWNDVNSLWKETSICFENSKFA